MPSSNNTAPKLPHCAAVLACKVEPAHSDIDFLVEFRQDDPGSLFHRYFGLQEALEQLFGRKIDLVSAGALSNPYFIAAVNQSRQPVYASASTQTA